MPYSLYDIYKELSSTPGKTYKDALVRSFTGRTESPITESNYSPEELNTLKVFLDNVYKKKKDYFSRPKAELLAEADKKDKLADIMEKRDKEEANTVGLRNQAKNLRNAAQGQMPSDFYVGYDEFQNHYPKDTETNWRDTLGQFRFKVDPETGKYQIYDKYGFDNPSHSGNVQRYQQMNPVSRATSSLYDFFTGNTSALGEAYLGKKEVPMSINLDIDQALLDKYKK